NRYRALARLVVGSRVLLVTATPVHNRIADLFHLFRLFLRDHDLTALGVPSLWRAARGDADRHAVTAAAARLSVSRSREHVQAGYGTGPVVLPFPERAAGESIRVGTAPDAELRQPVTGVAGTGTGCGSCARSPPRGKTPRQTRSRAYWTAAWERRSCSSKRVPACITWCAASGGTGSRL